MNLLAPLGAVVATILIVWAAAGIPGLNYVFGIGAPYAAIAIFLCGFVYRVLKWARAPVPFNIVTSCGQQKSFDWIKDSKIEAPSSRFGVLIRMALEVFLFRSLFRNVKSEFVSRENADPRLAFKTSLWLWLGALAFHYSFLVVFIRHYRFFSDPVPSCLGYLEILDGFFQVGSPVMMISGVVLFGAVLFLLARRLGNPQTRYFSLANDYFPLFLIAGIAGTGILMRYTALRVDIVAVKDLCLGLMTFRPTIPAETVGGVFYAHVVLVSILFAYFPFSKLMHMGGVLLSPSRNMISASRMFRHVNPWNAPVPVHTYEEYEDEFREKMKKADIPVDKE